jgi:nucleoside 2-deoxyribosyltransferase
MIIYLAGSVAKGDEEEKGFVNWRDRYKTVLENDFPGEFIFPRAGEVDETDTLLVVGKDSRSIKRSDLVVVNVEDKIGAGTAMELVIAKHFKKPVVTVLPKDTHHRRSNIMFEGVMIEDWIHPFIDVFSDMVVEKVEDIPALKERLQSIEIKDISIIDKAVAHRESFGI